MKLEKKMSKSLELRFKITIIIATFGFEALAVQKLFDYVKGNKYMLFFALIYALFPIVLLMVFKSVTNDDATKIEKIKELGTKVQGEIIDIKKLKRAKGYSFSQCLTVIFDGRSTMVCDIVENDAFSILKMLLDEYPFQNVKTVPVDVYTYKRNVYVDLESVDFTKVEGYEEAVKLLEDMKDDMTM